MPRPSDNAVFRPELGLIAYGFSAAAAAAGFIGTQVMPVFPVPLQAATYPVIPGEVLLELGKTARAARSGYSRSDYTFDDGNYFCRENGREELIDDSERKLYSRFFDAEVVSTQRAMNVVMRTQEKRIADKVNDTSKIPNAAATAKLTSPTTSVFRQDVKNAIKEMRGTVGLKPDILTISYNRFQDLLVTAELKDYLKYTTPYLLDTEEGQRKIVAQWLGLADVLIGNAIYNSAKKGQPLKVADIWPDDKAALVVRPSSANDLREPSLGRTFFWDADSNETVTVETYRDEPNRSDVVRARQYTDEAYTFVGGAYILTGLM